MAVITHLFHTHEDILSDPLLPFLENQWSSECASSMGRPLSLRAFLLSAEGDALLSQTILCGMQANTGGKHREFSVEKSEHRVEISKENMVTYKSPHFIPCISLFCVYLLYEGPSKKQQSHFSFKSNTAHFYFPICSTISVFFTNSHSH